MNLLTSILVIWLMIDVWRLRREIDDLRTEREHLNSKINSVSKRLNYIEFGEEGVNHGLDI